MMRRSSRLTGSAWAPCDDAPRPGRRTRLRSLEAMDPAEAASLLLHDGDARDVTDDDEEAAVVMVVRCPRSSRWCSRPWICVPDGVYALVTQSNGRAIEYQDSRGHSCAVWPPGLHWVPFRADGSQFVTKQHVIFTLALVDCLTADEVAVRVTVCVVLRVMGDAFRGEDPRLVRQFLHEGGPIGLENRLRALLEVAIRGCVADGNHSEVQARLMVTDAHQELGQRVSEEEEVAKTTRGGEHTTREPMPEDHVHGSEMASLTATLNRDLHSRGVQVMHAAVTQVELPVLLQADMQRHTAAMAKLEAENLQHMVEMQLRRQTEEREELRLARARLLAECERAGEAQRAQVQHELDAILSETLALYRSTGEGINLDAFAIC